MPQRARCAGQTTHGPCENAEQYRVDAIPACVDHLVQIVENHLQAHQGVVHVYRSLR